MKVGGQGKLPFPMPPTPSNYRICHLELPTRVVVGSYDISFISSAKQLTPYMVEDRGKLSKPTSASRVPIIPLLKLFTFRMAAQDRWSLNYFGHVAIKKAPRWRDP